MALILNIDTATEFASVCLSDDDKIISILTNKEQQNHASFLQPAIKKIIGDSKIQLHNIDAVAVTIGPGSYTGLRVGLASAKGLCYALQKPLITLNTLQIMAEATKQYIQNNIMEEKEILICPMIDARRKEVFTALYNIDLQIILPSCAMVIDENSFQAYLINYKLFFCGNGSEKCKRDICHPNAIFLNMPHSALNMIPESVKSFTDKNFTDITYCEPLYVKEFFSATLPK